MRERLDLGQASRDDMRRLLVEAAPSLVVNCAAYTSVDKAEIEKDLATEVNGHAVGRLAEIADDLGLPFVTFSTDYVFDGAGNQPYVESDTTDPINAYGRSKRVGEVAALAHPSALVIRTSWVLSATHRNFVTAILGRALSGESLKVVDDQRGCPTIADDLAKVSLAAARLGVTGLLHLRNQGETTWFEIARTSIRLAGADETLLEPCTTEEYPTPARRPAYSVLGSERLVDLTLPELPPWQESIRPVVSGAISILGQ
jgi:dTDP-4-dehydrorhamnose reductase